MARHTPPALPGPHVSRVLARNLLLVLVTLDLVVLAAFSVRVETRTTRTTSVPAASVTTGVAPAPAVPAPVDAGAPLGSGGAAVSGATATTPIREPHSPKSKTPKPSDETEQPLPDGSARIAPCPVHVGDSRTDGGLQSLVDFAPAFGPFSAEAFAAASSYQPALQLIGPILAKYPALAPRIEPLLKPMLDTWAQFLDQGFTVFGPLYAPYRTSVLEAETTFAAQLAPYSQQLAGSPAGGCLVELQNALLHDGPDT